MDSQLPAILRSASNPLTSLLSVSLVAECRVLVVLTCHDPSQKRSVSLLKEQKMLPKCKKKTWRLALEKMMFRWKRKLPVEAAPQSLHQPPTILTTQVVCSLHPNPDASSNQSRRPLNDCCCDWGKVLCAEALLLGNCISQHLPASSFPQLLSDNLL